MALSVQEVQQKMNNLAAISDASARVWAQNAVTPNPPQQFCKRLELSAVSAFWPQASLRLDAGRRNNLMPALCFFLK